ncbi:MAG TPA: hypothetical protein VN860_01200, partial [Candidatus Acidoferrales bacterium]|nr:hypothetical protein [Candidatus Acidoferrales bacterium]
AEIVQFFMTVAVTLNVVVAVPANAADDSGADTNASNTTTLPSFPILNFHSPWMAHNVHLAQRYARTV